VFGRIEGGVLVRFTEEFVELFWGDGRKRAASGQVKTAPRSDCPWTPPHCLRLLQKPFRSHALPAWPAARLLALYALLALSICFVAQCHYVLLAMRGPEG
jgi:hypothetical protein